MFQKCSIPPPQSEVPGNNYVHLHENWFFFLSIPMPSGLARAATHSWNVVPAELLPVITSITSLKMLLSVFSLGIIYLGVVIG